MATCPACGEDSLDVDNQDRLAACETDGCDYVEGF